MITFKKSTLAAVGDWIIGARGGMMEINEEVTLQGRIDGSFDHGSGENG